MPANFKIPVSCFGTSYPHSILLALAKGKPRPDGKPLTERQNRILRRRYVDLWTYRAIGAAEDISGERLKQILWKIAWQIQPRVEEKGAA